MTASPAIARLLPENWPYQNERAIVLPFSDRHPEIFPEDFLASVYCRLKEEKTLDIIFPGMGIQTLNQFLYYMGNPGRLGRLVACLRNPDAPPIPSGIGWMCEYEQGRASFGFGWFRSVWGKRVHVDFSMFMLHYWLVEMKSEVLYGTTVNPLALNYSRRFGFKHLCTLPKFFFRQGQLQSAELIVLEKDVFLGYYLNWLKTRERG